MAKGARSKSVRKNKTIKRALRFQPVVDARMKRIAERGHQHLADVSMCDDDLSVGGSGASCSVAASGDAMMMMMTDSAMQTTPRAAKKRMGRVSRTQGRRQARPLNSYGIPAKELFF